MDTDYWTLLCWTAPKFWDIDKDNKLSSPSLKCQSVYIIAEAMQKVAVHWHQILEVIETIMNDQNAFMDPKRLQGTFVEDESYSQSRKYYWAVKCLTEFIRSLSDGIQQWKSYREARVASYLAVKGEHFRDTQNIGKQWYSVAAADRKACASCGELESLRKSFEDKLEEVKLMRDGVSLHSKNKKAVLTAAV